MDTFLENEILASFYQSMTKYQMTKICLFLLLLSQLEKRRGLLPFQLGQQKFGRNPKCDCNRIKKRIEKGLKKHWKRVEKKIEKIGKKGNKSPNRKGK